MLLLRKILFITALVTAVFFNGLAGVAFPDPPGGWTYTFNGDKRTPGQGTDFDALDGTWSHNNGSDTWDGSEIGGNLVAGPYLEGNGPGGVSAITESGVTFLRMQDTGDPRDYGFADPSSRKIYFGHNITERGGSDTQLDDGITLSFRARVPVSGLLDQLHRDGQQAAGVKPYPTEGDGYVTSDGGKGNFVIKQNSGGAIAFSLTTAQDTPGGDPAASRANFTGLTMNEFAGNAVSGNVNFGQGSGTNTIAFDVTQWHEFWIVLRKDPANEGTHQGFIYMDGNLTPTVFRITAGNGSDYSGFSYLAMGMTATPQNAALDVDFVAYKLGAHFPGGAVDNLPPELTDLNPPVNKSFHPAADGISLKASTLGRNRINTTGVLLTLNGQTISTGVNVSGPEQDRQITYTGLVPNQVYRGEIIVRDQDGRASTNKLAFDTFALANVITVENEDYNHGGGQFQDNPPVGAFLERIGTPGIDYNDSLPTPGAAANHAYRSGDAMGTQTATDFVRKNHTDAGVAEMVVNQLAPGEWLNYTRTIPAGTYQVHLRMAATSRQEIRLDRVSNPAQANQQTQLLGVFKTQVTGNLNSFSYATLLDVNDQPLTLKLGGVTTLRITVPRGNGDLAMNYLVLAPVTAPNGTAISGLPTPGSTLFSPDGSIELVVHDGAAAVTPGSIKLFLDKQDVTALSTLTDTAEGVAVRLKPASFLAPGSSHTLGVSVGSAAATEWSFQVANLPSIPAWYATPRGSGSSRGFNVKIHKARNDASADLFQSTNDRAEAQLANQMIDPATSRPFENEAAGPGNNGLYTETGTINYSQAATDAGAFVPDATFPNLDASDHNYLALSATAYVELPAGVQRLGVRSDDGFRVTIGSQFTENTVQLGVFEGGRGTAPTEFDFLVPVAGVYAVRLLYYEGNGGADLEFYSVDRATGAAILINDPANPAAFPAFTTRQGNPVPPVVTSVTLANPRVVGNRLTFTIQSNAGTSYVVETKSSLSDPAWQARPAVAGTGSTLTLEVPVEGASRFVRVIAR